MIDLIKEIIKPYKYVESSPFHIFKLRRVKEFQIEESITPEIYLNILNGLKNKFGLPIFVCSFYGFIFKSGDKFIAFNAIEKTYGNDVINIFIFDKVPVGRKITYDRYLEIENLLKDFAKKAGLDYYETNNYFENKFQYIGINENVQVLIIIKKKELLYYISKLIPFENGKRVIPKTFGKAKINWIDKKSIDNGLDLAIKDIELI